MISIVEMIGLSSPMNASNLFLSFHSFNTATKLRHLILPFLMIISSSSVNLLQQFWCLIAQGEINNWENIKNWFYFENEVAIFISIYVMSKGDWEQYESGWISINALLFPYWRIQVMWICTDCLLPHYKRVLSGCVFRKIEIWIICIGSKCAEFSLKCNKLSPFAWTNLISFIEFIVHCCIVQFAAHEIKRAMIW